MSKQETNCIHGYENCNCATDTLPEWIEDEIAIFGDHKPVCRRTIDEYTQNLRVVGQEMDRFFDLLPVWVKEEDMFSLWIMPDVERVAWLEANAPKVETVTAKEMVNSPYRPVQLVPERKRETLGGVRF